MTRRLKIACSVLAALGIGTAASVLMAQSAVGPKDVAFPKGFETW